LNISISFSASSPSKSEQAILEDWNTSLSKILAVVGLATISFILAQSLKRHFSALFLIIWIF
jgi:hypothetical protein